MSRRRTSHSQIEYSATKRIPKKRNRSLSKARIYLSRYSFAELLDLVISGRGEKLWLEAGYTPTLIKNGKRVEVEGPDVTTETMQELLYSVAGTRQLRSFRERGTLDILHRHKRYQFLVR